MGFRVGGFGNGILRFGVSSSGVWRFGVSGTVFRCSRFSMFGVTGTRFSRYGVLEVPVRVFGFLLFFQGFRVPGYGYRFFDFRVGGFEVRDVAVRGFRVRGFGLGFSMFDVSGRVFLGSGFRYRCFGDGVTVS